MSDDETKIVYVKRWRTLVKLPARYADEIAEALRLPAPSPGWQGLDAASPEVKAAAERTMKADYQMGRRMVVALEDPKTCPEMRAVIVEWFEAHQPWLDMHANAAVESSHD